MAQRHNLITDVPGIKIGNAINATICTGVTVLRADAPMVAAVDVRGGGTGTRETEAVSPTGVVEEVHALVMSGGSAFGLSAASGVQSWLAEQGIGFAVRSARVPIVPQAILFDLLNGGDKAWGKASPYEALGYEACAKAQGGAFDIGSVGAGFGATTATLRGGLGSASDVCHDQFVVGAVAAVNAVGSATLGRSPYFWGHAFEQGYEFGGLGAAPQNIAQSQDAKPLIKGAPDTTSASENTTLAIVATNAQLTKSQAHRLAIMAQTGLGKSLHPVHTPLDGDVVFAVSTGQVPLSDPLLDLTYIGAKAAEVLARAVARGVYSAAPAPEGWQGPSAYSECFPDIVARAMEAEHLPGTAG